MAIERYKVRIVLHESHSPHGNGIRLEDRRFGCSRSTGSLGLKPLEFLVLLPEE